MSERASLCACIRAKLAAHLVTRIAYVPPSRFVGRGRYLLPTRITLRGRPYSVYRWGYFNFTLGRRA